MGLEIQDCRIFFMRGRFLVWHIMIAYLMVFVMIQSVSLGEIEHSLPLSGLQNLTAKYF